MVNVKHKKTVISNKKENPIQEITTSRGMYLLMSGRLVKAVVYFLKTSKFSWTSCVKT